MKQKSPSKKVKNVWMLIIGWFFLFSAIAVLFLPFLKGFIFLALGFYFISFNSEFLQKRWKKILKNYPRISPHFDAVDRNIRELFRL